LPVFSGFNLITRNFQKKLDIIFGEDLFDGDNRMKLPYFAVGSRKFS
jgi:hypothetical protein